MLEIVLLHVAGTITITSTTPSLAESLSTLVNSISLAAGAMAPIIVSILAYTKAKSHDPKLDS